MSKNERILSVSLRRQYSPKSLGYGKYYPRVTQREALSQRGFIQHLMDHGLAYPRHIVEGVIGQLTACLPELMLQGVSVKLDGLGVFIPYVSGEGSEMPDAEYNANDHIKGIHMRFLPDNTKLDKLTSKALKEKSSIQLAGVEVPISCVTRSVNGKSKTDYQWATVPLQDWLLLPEGKQGRSLPSIEP